MALDLNFADRVLKRAVAAGNSQQEIQAHLDSLDAAGQEKFINETGQAFGMEFTPDKTFTPDSAYQSSLGKKAEAATLGVAAQGPFGFGEELAPVSAAVEKGIGSATDLFRKEPLYDKSIPELTAETQGMYAEAKQNEPGAFATGEIAMAAAPALVGGAAATTLPFLATEGALTGAGTTEGGLLERGKGALTGAGIGVLTAGVFNAPSVLKEVGAGLKGMAGKNAVKTLGLSSFALERLGNRVEKLGDYLVKKGIAAKPSVLKTVATEVEAAKNKVGQVLDHTMNTMEKEAGETWGAMTKENLMGIVKRGLDSAEQFVDPKEVSKATAKMGRLLAKIPDDAVITPRMLWDFSKRLDKISRRLMKVGATASEEGLSSSLGQASKVIRSELTDLANQTGVGKAWGQAAKNYGMLAEASEGVSKTIRQSFKKGKAGHWLGLNKVIDSTLLSQPARGTVTGALSLGSKLTNFAAKATGPFAAPLQAAAEKGFPALAAAHYTLMHTNEDYRKAWEKRNESEAATE